MPQNTFIIPKIVIYIGVVIIIILSLALINAASNLQGTRETLNDIRIMYPETNFYILNGHVKNIDGG